MAEPGGSPRAAMAGSVVVAGASSQVGWFLLPRLAVAGRAVIALTRRPPGRLIAEAPYWARMPEAVEWRQADLATATAGTLPAGEVWINVGPLGLLPPRIPELAGRGVRRVIAFSSTSRYTKQASADPRERALVDALARAEDQLATACGRAGIGWTLFRPTLIYGAGLDRNVMMIAAIIRRWGFFPLVGGGRGLRQPVHADDLAVACLEAMRAPATQARSYDLSGGEVLDYRTMVQRVCAVLGRPARFIAVPLPVLRVAFLALRLSPRYRDFNVQMARRMAEDMVFGHDAASADFGYRPRGFQPVVEAPAAGLEKQD